MTATAEDWAVQVSIKHGPPDDRGNPQYMTNIRGASAAEVLGHASELAEFATELNAYLNTFVAGESLVREFPTALPVETTTVQPGSAAQGSATRAIVATGDVIQKAREGKFFNGQVVGPCPFSNTAKHRFKKGTNKDTGNAWKAIMCSNEPECGVEWIRD